MGVNVVKLEDIANVDYGTRVVKSKVEGDEYPVYGGGGETFRINKYNRENCVVVSRFAMSPKCTRYVNEKIFLNDSGLTVSTKDNSLLLQEYLDWYLLSKNDEIYSLGRGAGQRNLEIPSFKRMLISYPIDIEEQRKIISQLKLADEIRAKKKLANDKLDEFLKSTFISMFGDPVKNDKGFDTTILQNIGSFKNGINYNAGDNGYSIKCIGVGDFKNGTILNSIDKLNSVEVNQTPNEEYFVRKKDIVFVRSNGSKELVGRTLLINTDLQENIVYSGFCIRLRVEQENINNMFLLQLLNTKPIKDNMKNDGHGCNIKSLNQTILGNIPVIIPPIEDQNKFAQIVEKVEAQKQKNELVIEQMNNLFNSLSQRAFKGEL